MRRVRSLASDFLAERTFALWVVLFALVAVFWKDVLFSDTKEAGMWFKA